MDMDSTKEILENRLEKAKQKKYESLGVEYKSLYIRVGAAAFRDYHIRKIKPTAFTVYMCLVSRSNKDSIAYPSLFSIGRETGICIDTVSKSIEVLCKNQWIKHIGRTKTKNGRFGNNTYLLLKKDIIRYSNDPNFIDNPVGKNPNGTQT